MKLFRLLPQPATPTQYMVRAWVAAWPSGSQVGSKLGSTLETAVFGLVMRESSNRVAGVATYSKTNPKRAVQKDRMTAKKAYRNNNRDNLLHLLPHRVQWGTT